MISDITNILSTNSLPYHHLTTTALNNLNILFDNNTYRLITQLHKTDNCFGSFSSDIIQLLCLYMSTTMLFKVHHTSIHNSNDI